MQILGEETYLQCPCGRVIKDASEYKIFFLKKENREIDILCPNEACHVRELGYILFGFDDNKVKLRKAVWYPIYVTWNKARLGGESDNLLREHMKGVIKRINWKRIVDDYKNYLEQLSKLREEERLEEAMGESVNEAER